MPFVYASEETTVKAQHLPWGVRIDQGWVKSTFAEIWRPVTVWIRTPGGAMDAVTFEWDEPVTVFPEEDHEHPEIRQLHRLKELFESVDLEKLHIFDAERMLRQTGAAVASVQHRPRGRFLPQPEWSDSTLAAWTDYGADD